MFNVGITNNRLAPNDGRYLNTHARKTSTSRDWISSVLIKIFFIIIRLSQTALEAENVL